jgi:inorganic triphosphatase YgiF
LCEIELELKRGREDALFEIARRLVDALPAQLAVKSKSERGYELLEGAGVRAVKAVRVELHSGMSATDGFRGIGRACLKQVVDNVPALRAGEAEGVHQMRVGLRRLRAAMSLFGDILPDPETAAVKREVKWLTAELARARQFDVLVQRVLAPVQRHRPRLAGISSISQDLVQQREAALERAKNAVQSVRFRRLLIDIAAWLETGKWTSPQDDLLRDRAGMPVATFAPTELTRRWKKFRKKGKKLRKLDRRGRHKLRIQGKKLRYASEFLASLFPGKKAVRRRKTFLSQLEDLQDRLGDLNDIVAHEELIKANAGLNSRTSRRRGSRKRAFAAGLLTGREAARFEPVLAAATDAFAALAKRKPFW